MISVKQSGDFPYVLLAKFCNFVLLLASFFIMLYSITANPEEQRIVRVEGWFPLIVLAVQAVNFYGLTCNSGIFKSTFWAVFFVAAAGLIVVTLGYNLVELYQYYKNSQTTADYLIMMQLLYLLATVTGPVALYGVSLIAVVLLYWFEEPETKKLYYLIRV